MRKMKKKELKRASMYCDAINEDLWNCRGRNCPNDMEVRGDIVPRAIKWINSQLCTVCLYIKHNQCYVSEIAGDYGKE